MREEYDFSNAVKNPYVGKLKQQITIRLDEQVIDYFKKMSEETGMPYQNIINYYLLDCVKEKKHMEVAFAKQKHITIFKADSGSSPLRYNPLLCTRLTQSLL